ncbi:hypothetical protein, partial [Enterobacter roggenkampii]|uniref:hypothetical protein n=1 Tax=Enterobacter roggenkampii TaxID=1812935 RepID=UPI00195396F5
FSLIAALLLGSSATSAAVPPTSEMPLQSRIEAAQKTIDTLLGSQPGSAAKTGSARMAFHRGHHHWHDWSNWHNHWSDHHHRH